MEACGWPIAYARVMRCISLDHTRRTHSPCSASPPPQLHSASTTEHEVLNAMRKLARVRRRPSGRDRDDAPRRARRRRSPKGDASARQARRTVSSATTCASPASPRPTPARSFCAWSIKSAIALDDTVGQHLPSMPLAWQGVTIRQLLNHTSGIPDYTKSEGLLQPVPDRAQGNGLAARRSSTGSAPIRWCFRPAASTSTQTPTTSSPR